MLAVDDWTPPAVVPLDLALFQAVALDQVGVARKPLRPLPHAGLEKLSSERFVAAVIRALHQIATTLPLFLRVDNAVGLIEVLLGAVPDVFVVALFVVEAGNVGCVRVDHTRIAVCHPLGNDLGHARPFLYPNRSCGPQILNFDGLAKARHGIGRQAEQAVDGVLDLGVAEHIHQLDGLFHLLVEVVGGKGHLGRCERRFLVRRNLVGVMKDRSVSIRAHLHRTGRLALVAERVHVADDRIANLVVGFSENVHRANVSHLVNGRDERNRCSSHVGDAVAPHATRNNDVVGFDPAAVGHDSADLLRSIRPVRCLNVFHLGVRKDLQHTLVHRFVTKESSGIERVDHRHRRAVEAAEDHIIVDERNEFLHFCWREQLGLDSPRFRAGHPAIEFVHSLLSSSNLDATRIDAAIEIAILVGALHAEQRHLLVVIDRENEVRRMTGATAGVR